MRKSAKGIGLAIVGGGRVGLIRGEVAARHPAVEWIGSYPPGDMALGELRGPMRDETDLWLGRVSMGLPTQAATAAEAHRNLMLTKALDLSAKRKKAVALPLGADQEREMLRELAVA